MSDRTAVLDALCSANLHYPGYSAEAQSLYRLTLGPSVSAVLDADILSDRWPTQPEPFDMWADNFQFDLEEKVRAQARNHERKAADAAVAELAVFGDLTLTKKVTL